MAAVSLRAEEAGSLKWGVFITCRVPTGGGGHKYVSVMCLLLKLLMSQSVSVVAGKLTATQSDAIVVLHIIDFSVYLTWLIYSHLRTLFGSWLPGEPGLLVFRLLWPHLPSPIVCSFSSGHTCMLGVSGPSHFLFSCSDSVCLQGLVHCQYLQLRCLRVQLR